MNSDPTLLWRALAGGTFFAALAYYDWRKHPGNPRRVKEYGFLFGVTMLAMAYGVLHDIITYHLSPAYYIYGKGLASAQDGFNADVVTLALKATWTAGLIGAVALLLANNPHPLWPQLPYVRLAAFAAVPFSTSIGAEWSFGAVTWWCSSALRAHLELPPPTSLIDNRFLVVAGMHWGAYLGGALGVAAACWLIRRQRWRLSAI